MRDGVGRGAQLGRRLWPSPSRCAGGRQDSGHEPVEGAGSADAGADDAVLPGAAGRSGALTSPPGSATINTKRISPSALLGCIHLSGKSSPSPDVSEDATVS